MTAREPAPLQHLRDVERDYGRLIWRSYEQLLERVRSSGTRWPGYIHAPLAAAYALASDGGPMPPERASDVARLGALSAWRVTKGIYRFDPDLRDALVTTPLDRDLPIDVLTRLPEWCVYLDFSDAPLECGPLHIRGAYVHLEVDSNNKRLELRVLAEIDGALIGMPIHLGRPGDGRTLSGGAEDAALEARANAAIAGESDLKMRAHTDKWQEVLRGLAPLVSLALYLCTEEPDLRADDDPARRPSRPKKPSTAQRVTVWDAGWRLGAALRRAREIRSSEDQGGSHASPVGHVRRAHWHAYWMGSEAKKNRRRELKWLAPMLVGLDLGDDLAAVVRRVT